MLGYDRQTKSGLVALYDIRPGNGAGPFLQPRSPHGAHDTGNMSANFTTDIHVTILISAECHLACSLPCTRRQR